MLRTKYSVSLEHYCRPVQFVLCNCDSFFDVTEARENAHARGTGSPQRRSRGSEVGAAWRRRQYPGRGKNTGEYDFMLDRVCV